MKPIILVAALVVTAAVPSAPAIAGDFRATLVEAQKQFEQTHYEQALKLYKQADEMEPGHPAVQYDIGLCHLNLGDGDKSIQQFESVATQAKVSPMLQRDSFYNIGFIRASSASRRFKEVLAPATQPADQIPPDAPANIEKLKSIADELLRGISAFKNSRKIETSNETEHNIRAARIMRRDVLGLLRKAVEKKEKKDILEDPRGYLESLIYEQDRQVSLTRYLMISPPGNPAQTRQARRAAVRLQKKIMEHTATFADHLSQFREAAKDQDTKTPASQPSDKTPREKVYHAAAKQIETAVESQRNACAHFLDAEIEPAFEQQFAAMDEMCRALYLFPLDPAQALVKSRVEQAQLKESVTRIESQQQWLWDPLLGDAPIPEDAQLESSKTAIHYHQMQIGNLLSILRMQCRHIATTSQPADGPDSAQPQNNPLLDPELNAKLADALEKVDDLVNECLQAIMAHNKEATLTAQNKLLAMIDAALELLPKSMEQRITELIVRQSRLNAEVKAEVGDAEDDGTGQKQSLLDEVGKWASRLKSTLFPTKPAKVADALRSRQKNIQKETVAVNDEIRQQIPSGASTQPGSASPSPGAPPAQVQAYIEAAKHLTNADTEMSGAIEGLDKVVIQNSLKPMHAHGPVQAAQAKALEELAKALAALKPPEQQPKDDEQDKKDQQQKQKKQQKQDSQDTQREIDRLDKERERAMRELYQKKPRTVIKDW